MGERRSEIVDSGEVESREGIPEGQDSAEIVVLQEDYDLEQIYQGHGHK